MTWSQALQNLTFGLYHKWLPFNIQKGSPPYQIWDLSKYPFLKYLLYNVFTIWSPLIPNDLSLKLITGFLSLIWFTKYRIRNLSKLPSVEYHIDSSYYLTPVDPHMTLTTKNSSCTQKRYTFIPNMRICPSKLHFWRYYVSQCFHCLTTAFYNVFTFDHC